MGAEQKPAKKQEVVRITQQQNTEALAKKGLPPHLAAFSPGADWLLEHGGFITGHIEEGSGDIVIDTHEGGDKPVKPATPKPKA